MIHSFEIYFGIHDREIGQLFSMYGVNCEGFEHFGAAVKQLNNEVKDNYEAFAIRGIYRQGGSVWNLHLKVDVIKLLDKGDVTEADYPMVESSIRDFLIDHFGQSSYFDSHILNRIDYRVDVTIPEQKERELLFHLLEKYTKKYRYKEKIKWGMDKTGNPLKYETSQYHKCKSVEFIIYSKEDERMAKGKKVKPYEEGVVRYELRLKNEHLNSMKSIEKGKGRPKKLRTYFSYQLFIGYMEKHIMPIIHKGDYYKITEAEKIIDRSSFSKNKKEKLRSFLITISKGSADTPRRHGMSSPTYRQYIRDLESIGINLVLIPKNRTDYPSHFRNPFKL